MRIALISDIHGNEVALKAVLADIGRRGVDEIICLGDVATLGPRPRAVIAILCELGCRCIMGNHDEFLLDPELIQTYPGAAPIAGAVDWCRSQLGRQELDFLRAFSQTIEMPLGPLSTLLLYHGSPTSHMHDILATTAPQDLDELLAGHAATVMAGGHTHIQMLRQHRGHLLVNPGSVGMPFEEYVGGRVPVVLAHAEYATVEDAGGGIHVTLHRLPLEKALLREAMAATDNPLRDAMLKQYA